MSDSKEINDIVLVRKTIAMLTSIIHSGEKHSDRSIEQVNKAIHILSEMKANEANKQPEDSIVNEVVLGVVISDKELQTIKIDIDHIIKHVTLDNEELGKRTRIIQKISDYFSNK